MINYITTDKIKNQLYDAKEILNMPHVKRLLLERYLFKLDPLITEYINKKLYQTKKYKVERKKDSIIGIETDVQMFDTEDGKETYFETFEAMARRVARKITSGFIGLLNEKNSKYIEETEEWKQLKNMYYNKPDEFVEYLNDFSNKVEYAMNNLYFLPSSPFMFNAMRGTLENTDILVTVYKDKIETIEEWNKLYEVKDPAYGSCYTMGTIEDDIKSIYEMLYEQAEVFRKIY